MNNWLVGRKMLCSLKTCQRTYFCTSGGFRTALYDDNSIDSNNETNQYIKATDKIIILT